MSVSCWWMFDADRVVGRLS